MVVSPMPMARWFATRMFAPDGSLHGRAQSGAANFNETQAVLFAFQGVGAYPHSTWLDFHGSQFAGAHLD